MIYMGKEYATREIKLETIRRSVVKCSEQSLPAIKEKLIGMCGEWWGTARQTAQAMLKELVANEKICIDGEDVWSWERFQKILEARAKDYIGMRDIIEGQKEEVYQETLKALKAMPRLGDMVERDG